MRSTLGVLLLVAVAGPPAHAQRATPAVTVNPAMVKGPAGAPVTILEFSDYQ
jgi:hypothetical protein